MIEQIQKNPESLDEQFARFVKAEPDMVKAFTSADGADQKRAFLRGEIRNPDHTYQRLDEMDFVKKQHDLATNGAALLANPELNPKFAEVYKESVEGAQKKTRLLELAYEFKHADDPTRKQQLGEEYMKLNTELFGRPDEETYRSLLQEKLAVIAGKELSSRGQELRRELFSMVDYDESAEKIERFRPSPETIAWVHDIVESLYGGMLSHVPDKQRLSVQEIRDIFQEIIDEEFDGAAEGWVAELDKVKVVTVRAKEKRVLIPENWTTMSKETVRDLVVHELGVHMLRAVMGEETDLPLLSRGLSGYLDSEEGLAMVLQQALNSKYIEAGNAHYITAGAAEYDHMDPRDAFEMKWRLGVLGASEDGKVISELDIAKAKKKAYREVADRSFRGTDELPWFKDLSYYNGTAGSWKHLEEIRGDDTRFMFVLLGKNNPSNKSHERVVYETRTR